MAKLTREQKIEIYHKKKSGVSNSSLSKQYGIAESGIRYLIKLIDKHGEDILRKNKNNYYYPEQKLEIINKVLIEKQSVKSTAIEYGLLSHGMLVNWIKFYKENGYTTVEKSEEELLVWKK